LLSFSGKGSDSTNLSSEFAKKKPTQSVKIGTLGSPAAKKKTGMKKISFFEKF